MEALAKIELEQEQELEREAVSITEQVNSVQVDDQESFSFASEMVVEIDGMIKKVKDYWKDPKERAYQAHKAITQKEKDMLCPLEERRKILTSKINVYLTEQEKIRKEEQRRLELERQNRERREREALEEKAREAEVDGNAEAADLFRQQKEELVVPVEIAAPAIEKTTRMESGSVTQKKELKIEVTDPMAFLRAICEGKAPASLVEIKAGPLKSWVKLNGFKIFPGLSIREEVGASFRSR